MSVEGFLVWFLVAVVLAIGLFFAFANLFKNDDGTKVSSDGWVGVSLAIPFVGVMFLFSSLFNTSVITNELVSLNTGNNLSGEMFIVFGTGSGELKDELVINYIQKTNDDTLNFTIETISADLAKISYVNEGEAPYIEKTCQNPLGAKSENCFRLTEIIFHVPEGSVSNEIDVKI